MSISAEHLRVAVITPYYQETLEVLKQCHASVRRQTYPCTHFLVSDGHPQADVQNWSVEHIVLSRPHADVGNTPRAVGSLVAMNEDFDAIAYLDADNWYHPAHIESMVDLHRQTEACVCTATRDFHRLDGSFMCTDTYDSDGQKHADTSCLFLTRAAFEILPLWAMMPKQLGAAGDQIVWEAIVARGFPRAHCRTPTVAFRTQYQIHYQNAREVPPPGTKTYSTSTGKAESWWLSLPPDTRLKWQRYFRTRVL